MTKLTKSGLVVAGLTATLLAPLAIADEDNPHIVHRQGIYKVASGHMAALKSILFLDHPAQEDVNFHATAMLDAFKHLGNAYPEGSDKGKTRAKKAIWKDPEGFKEKGQAAGQAIFALVDLSSTGMADKAELVDAFKKVGGACKGCHDDYRKKKK